MTAASIMNVCVAAFFGVATLALIIAFPGVLLFALLGFPALGIWALWGKWRSILKTGLIWSVIIAFLGLGGWGVMLIADRIRETTGGRNVVAWLFEYFTALPMSDVVAWAVIAAVVFAWWYIDGVRERREAAERAAQRRNMEIILGAGSVDDEAKR